MGVQEVPSSTAACLVSLVQVQVTRYQLPILPEQGSLLAQQLATAVPQAAKYWNHSNNEKAPHQVLAGSNQRAEWKCQYVSGSGMHLSTSAPVKDLAVPNTALGGGGIPWSHPTFEEANFAALAQWGHERNAADDILPHNINLGSHMLTQWVCRDCPKGQLHCSQAAAFTSTGEQPTGCPYCAGYQPCVCNSVENLHLSVAAELDCDKNGFTAGQVLAHSHKKVWWQDQEGHGWEQRVQSRTAKKDISVATGETSLTSWPK